MSKSDEPVDPMAFLEQTQQFVSTMTGVKQQFIDAGWHEHNAEKAAIELLAASARRQS